MSDKSSEKRKMSSLSEASNILREIAGPRDIGDGVKTLLLRAHRRLAIRGFSFNRVKDIYHQDPRIKISADEMKILREMRDTKEQEATNELRELLARVERLEAMLAAGAARDSQGQP